MLIFFFGYVGLITALYGLQPSVSESVYRLPVKWRFVFTLATFGYAICAMAIGLHLTGNGLVFLAGAAIGFVGAAPMFHDDTPNDRVIPLEKVVHLVGATIGIVTLHIFLWMSGAWYLAIGFAVLTVLAGIVDRCRLVLWLEILAMISLSVFYEMNLKVLFN